jgi:ketosteroid isomerase-like protein
MAQENADFVRSVFAAFDGVNVAEIDFTAEAVREILERVLAADVELRTLESGSGAGVGEFYAGVDGFIRYLGEWLEPFSEYEVENLDYIEAGDWVLVPSHQWGVGSGSGVRVELDLTTAYLVRDGRVTRIDQFDTLDEARARSTS